MTDDLPTDTAENASPSDSAESGDEIRAARFNRVRKWGSPAVLRWGLWTVAVVCSVTLLLVLFFFIYRHDAQTDPAEADSAVTAAREGSVTVYSYASDTIERDIANAKSHLTGDFLQQYETDSATGAVALAKHVPVRTSATVVDAAVSAMRPNSADVLVFLNLTSRKSDDPAPQVNNGSLMVSLVKVDGKWLISSMKPV